MAEGLPDPRIYSDSAVVVNHVNKKWKCRHPSLLPLLMSVESIQQEFRFQLIQVPRSYVSEPDAMCNQFLNELEAKKNLLIPNT